MKHYTTIAILAMLGGFCLRASAQDVIKDTLEFDKAMATTPSALLQGKVSGVRVSSVDGNINGAVNTNIRGINAIRSNSQPLWIVDGVMVNASLNSNLDAFYQSEYSERSYLPELNALSFLNAYDIESIEVIKDLSAAAIYGAKGANGVIIVTSKLPRQGEFNLNWNSNAGIATSEFGESKISHNHSVSLNGFTGRTRYNVSGFYRINEGVIDGNNSTMGGMKVKLDTRANSVLAFGLNASFTMGDMSNIGGTAYYLHPSQTIAMRNDSFFPSDSKEGWTADFDDKSGDKRGNVGMYLTLNFTPSLSLKTTLASDMENNIRSVWYGNGTSFGLENNGAASVLSSTIFRYNGKSVLSWNRYFNDYHKINVEGGFDAFGEITKYGVINGCDYFAHDLRSKGISIAGSRVTSYKYDHSYFTYGVFADASYSYKDIAGANVIFRGDDTPRYNPSFEDNFRLYKAASVFFDLKNAFLKNSDVVSTLKIKAGYGEAGHEEYVPYRLYDSYLTGAYPRIDPEISMFYDGLNCLESKEYNAGIELGFIHDRLTIGFGWYDKNTDDTFKSYRFGIPGETLWKYYDCRLAYAYTSSVANRGLEGGMSARIIDNKDVQWTVSANGAYNVNQLTKVFAYDIYGANIGNSTVANVNALGESVGSIFGYKTTENGQYVDVNKNGAIDGYDLDVIGHTVPKFFGGLNTVLSVKNFTAEIQGDAALGFDILNLNDLMFKEADPCVISEKYVEKGDYFRIGRVSVGYNVPLKQNKFIKSMKVSASALNLCTISKYSGWNPDVNSFGRSGFSRGIDYGSYPMSQGFVLGVNLNF